MSKQGKLPLNKDEARLKLGIDASADTEAEDLVAQDDGRPTNSPESVAQETIASETGTEEMTLEPDYQSAETMGQQEEKVPHSLGENLRDERERQGLSLHDVADQLRLRPKQIEALENGDYDSLPGHTFVAGFLRSYANLLHLDAVAIVDLYRSESKVGPQTTELAFPEPTSEGRVPGGGLILGALVLVAALFAGWYFYLEENRVELEQVANLPSELLDKISSEEQIVASPTDPVEPAAPSVDVSTPELILSENASEDAATAPATELLEVKTEPAMPNASDGAAAINEETVDDAPDVTVSASDILAEKKEVLSEKTELPSEMATTTNQPLVVEAPSATETASAENVKSAVPSTEEVKEVEASPNYPQSTLATPGVSDQVVATAPSRGEDLGVENADSRVVLVAVQETWVQVADDKGNVVFDSILNAGDSYMLPNRNDLQLSTANAGGLEVRLDGKSIGMLGLNGVIVQSMPVTDESLREKIVAPE